MTTDRRLFLQTSVASLVSLLGACRALPFTDAPSLPGFESVAANLRDGVSIPPGYTYSILYRWGDPTGMASALPRFRPDASNSADEQALQAGMHHDGMHFFPLGNDGGRGLLVMNHEYTDEGLLHRDGVGQWTQQKVRKSQHAMGVSVIEVTLEPQGWRQVLPSRYARRIHGATPIRIGGPAAGHAAMRTAANPAGDQVLGTFANCAMGVTPWGTYLTCEENFHGYFGGPKDAGFRSDALQRRYGVAAGAQWVEWWRFDERFDVTRHPNEANRFGWVVEIDPMDPAAMPVKRTALGRKRQESATCRLTRDGRVAVYMGDDGRFEYIYKFVSRDTVRPGGYAANRDILDHGSLYAARFDDTGRGTWLELRQGLPGLTPDNGFATQAEVAIGSRLAADAVGATKMDRPEWIAIHPQTGEVFVTLTNNTQRGDPGRPAPDAANPRAGNAFGHIIRWQEDAGDAAATGFTWSQFVLAGDPAAAGAGTRYPAAGADIFGAPDGLHFDSAGLLWIQTDMSGQLIGQPPYTALGNNAMLCANVSTGRIRRFMTAPPGAEFTGCVVASDRRTLFVNVQHPGETRDDGDAPPSSAWPDGTAPGQARPRSATLVVRRTDGGIIGT